MWQMREAVSRKPGTMQADSSAMQVLGNAKGVVAAGISILIFKNPVTLQGAVGYAIALFGVALYTHVSPPSDGRSHKIS